MAFADKKAAFAYVNEYQKEKYDRITVMAGKGKKAEYQAAAKAAGMSLSAFIEMCVDEKISKEYKGEGNPVPLTIPLGSSGKGGRGLGMVP